MIARMLRHLAEAFEGLEYNNTLMKNGSFDPSMQLKVERAKI